MIFDLCAPGKALPHAKSKIDLREWKCGAAGKPFEWRNACAFSEGKSLISSEGELIWGPRKCVSFLGIRSKQANGKAFGARQKLKWSAVCDAAVKERWRVQWRRTVGSQLWKIFRVVKPQIPTKSKIDLEDVGRALRVQVISRLVSTHMSVLRDKQDLCVLFFLSVEEVEIIYSGEEAEIIYVYTSIILY